jgi:hypothetical protein
MSDVTAAPRINSVLELLDIDNPSVLDGLRARHPAQEQLLRKGLIMWPTDLTAGNDALYCDLCREGLSAAERQLEALLKVLPQRLARAKKLRLVTASAASLSSAGVLTAVFANVGLAARLAAVIAFVTTVGNLVAQYVETPLTGGKASIADSVRELVALESRLRDSKVRLAEAEQAHAEASPRNRKVPSCRQLVEAVNEMAAQIRQIQIFAGTT